MPGDTRERRHARLLDKYRQMSNVELSAQLRRVYDGEPVPEMERDVLLEAIAERLDRWEDHD